MKIELFQCFLVKFILIMMEYEAAKLFGQVLSISQRQLMFIELLE